MKLALFDLDNTLLHGDSDFEWAQYLVAQGVLDREVYEARNLESDPSSRRWHAGSVPSHHAAGQSPHRVCRCQPNGQ